MTGARELLRAVSVWAASPSPSPSPSSGSGHFTNTPDQAFAAASGLSAIVGYGAWFVTAIAIGTLMGVGLRWAVSAQNGGHQENLTSLGRWGAGALLAASIGSLANTLFGFNLFTPHPQAIPGLAGVQHALNIIDVICMCGGVLGIFAAAATMMMRHKHGEAAGEVLLYVLGGCMIIASASSITYGILPW